MRPRRSARDEEWGVHIRHRANASPSEQSRHENSSAELPRLSHNERDILSRHISGYFVYKGLTHCELNRSHVSSECHSTSFRSSSCSWLHRVSLSSFSSSSASSDSPSSRFFLISLLKFLEID